MERMVLIKKKKRPRPRITAQKVAFGIAFVLFTVYALTMLIPFFILVAYSFEDKIIYEINLGQPFKFPAKLVFDNYVYAFQELTFRDTNFFGMVFNSLWYTVIATIGPLFMNTCVGYAVSKYKFKARGIYYGVLIFCMTVPIIGTTGATLKLYSDLALYNTGPLLHIVTHLGAGGMGFLVMYAFYKNISWEYAEAALIDGANHFTVFFRIMIPMAIPAMGALALLNGIARVELLYGRFDVQSRLAYAGERFVRTVAHVAASGQHACLLRGARNCAYSHIGVVLYLFR